MNSGFLAASALSGESTGTVEAKGLWRRKGSKDNDDLSKSPYHNQMLLSLCLEEKLVKCLPSQRLVQGS